MIRSTDGVSRHAFGIVVAVIALTLASSAARAQVVITEVMYDPLFAGDVPWEWVEIKNTGASPVDLHGWVFGDRASRYNFANLSNTISDTVVPAGGVAILYNAANLNPASRFMDAWGSGIRLIGISPANVFPGMGNSSGYDRIGLWSTYESYNSTGMTPTTEPPWENAVFEMDYTAAMAAPNPFPSGSGGKSIAWKGSGDVHLGSNWVTSAIDDAYGAHASVMTIIVGGQINSTSDAGTPGLVLQGGTPPAGKLLFTEIMYNPASTLPGNNEAPFEWVEVYNNTGAAIDFSATPYVLDDDDDASLTKPNLISGSIAQGGVGVLFNPGTVSLAQMKAAWEPEIGQVINFIPVATEDGPAWTGLANSADAIAIWSSLSAYSSEAQSPSSPRRTFNNAIVTVSYTNDPTDPENPWPDDDNAGSIYLNDLGAADVSIGANWTLTGGGDDPIGTVNPRPITSDTPDNPGGEVGSPGFVPAAAALLGDYNGNNVVDAADYTVWRDHLGTGFDLVNEDPSVTPGDVTVEDYGVWKAHFGETPPGSGSIGGGAVPEPTSAVLLVLASIMGLLGQRRDI